MGQGKRNLLKTKIYLQLDQYFAFEEHDNRVEA